MENLRIKWKRAHREYSYFADDVAELPADKVAELVESGHVILFPGVDEKEVNPLPENLPARDLLFENGFTSLDQIKQAGESLSQIKGLGKNTLKSIADFISLPE